MLSESEGGKEEGIKKLEVGTEERKEEEKKEGEEEIKEEEEQEIKEEEENQTEKEGEKKEEDVTKEGVEEVISKSEESIEEAIKEGESVGLKEPEERKSQPEEEKEKNQPEEEEEKNQPEEEKEKNQPEEEEEKISSALASSEDQRVPPAPVVQSSSLTVQEPLIPSTKESLIPSTKEPLDPESEEPLIPSTKEPLIPSTKEPLIPSTKEPLDPESEESKDIEPSKPSGQGLVEVPDTDVGTTIGTVGQSAVPVQVSGKKEAKETTKPPGTPVSKKAPTEPSKAPTEESEVPTEESKKVPTEESKKVPTEVSKPKETVEKMKQSPSASPSCNTNMKPGTPMNVPSQSQSGRSTTTPSPGPKVPTPGQMQQIVVVSSGEGSIVSSGIQSMPSGSMSFTSSPHNMVTVQNAMIQQQQMLMPGQGMVNQSMITNPGGHHGHGSHPIQIVPQGTFLSPSQPMYIQSPTMFSNNPNQNLITIQQPFLTQGGLSLQLPQSMNPGNVGGVSAGMGGVNAGMGGVNTNMGGVNTNMGGVNTVGGVNNNNGAKIAMPKNMTGMGGALNTINKPGVSTVVNSTGQQSQSGQSGLRPIFSSAQYNQGGGQFVITQQPNQSFVLSGHQLINSQQSMNKSLNESLGKKGVILSKNQTILPSTGTFSGRPLIPNLFQQQTFLQSSPFPQLTQWSGGHQQLFNGQPQLIIRNHQGGDPQQFQYITNPMGQPSTVQFVQSSGQSFATSTNQLIQHSNQVGSCASQNNTLMSQSLMSQSLMSQSLMSQSLMSQSPGSNGGSSVPTMGKVSTPGAGSPEKKLKPLAVRPNMSTMSTQTAVGTNSASKTGVVTNSPNKTGVGTNSPNKVIPSTDGSKGMKSIKAGTKGSVQTVAAPVQTNQVKPVAPKATSVAINTPLGKNGVVEKGSGSKAASSSVSKVASSSVSKVASSSVSKAASTSVGTEKAECSVQVSTLKGSNRGSKTTTAALADDPNIQRPPYKRNVPVQKVEEFNAKAAQMHQQAILAAASGQMSPSMVSPSLPLPKTPIPTPNLKSTPTLNPKALSGGKNETSKVKGKGSTDKVPQATNSHAQTSHVTGQSNPGEGSEKRMTEMNTDKRMTEINTDKRMTEINTDKRIPEMKVVPSSQTRQLRATRMRTQPQVLRHVIENYIIEESSHPFPVDGRTLSPDKINGSADGKTNGSADQKTNGSADGKANGKLANGNHDMTPGINGSKRGFDSPALSPDSGSCSSSRSEMAQSKQENFLKHEKQDSSISPDRCASCCKIVPKSKFKTKNGMKVCPTCFNKKGATSAAKSNNQQLDLFNRVTSPGPLSEYDFKPENPTAISAGSKAGQLTTAGRQLSTVDRLASDHHHDEPMGPTPAKKAKGNKKQAAAMETTQVTHVQTLPVPTQPKLPPTPTTPGTFIPESGTDLQKWNVQDVYDFVRNLAGCEEFADEFKSQEIDGQALLLLKEEHLMSAMGMKLGPALKLFKKIQEIKSKNEVN